MRNTPPAIRTQIAIVLGAAALLIGGATPAVSAPAANDGVIGNDAPAWSPDGTRIAFTSFRNNKGDIYVMDVDGTHQRRLTNDQAYDDLPVWSHDGKHIAFVSNRSGRLQLWLMNADGSDQHQLTSTAGTSYFASWSPDDSHIAFRTDQDGHPEIYTIKTDSTELRRLTHSPSAAYSPSWGPDGRILFVDTGTTGGKASLWVMNADGSDQHRFTPRSFVWNERSPAWSPDGKKIVYQADRDVPLGNTELYVLDVDTFRQTRLTTYPGQDNFPTWSPDGKRIAFARGPSPFRNEIYVMGVDGKSVRELTQPKLGGIDFGTIPALPTAGRSVTVVYDVAEVSGADIGKPTVTCSARAGRGALRPVRRSFTRANGRASCTWRLPGNTRGKRLVGRIAVHSPGGTIVQRFNFAIR